MGICKGKMPLVVTIKRVIFNAPATFVFWIDGSKTVAKAQNGEPFDIWCHEKEEKKHGQA